MSGPYDPVDAARRAVWRAEKKAAERSRRLAEYHAGMKGLWLRLADAQDRRDMGMVRESADAIRRATEEEFRRREGAPP